jgi:hypothetical protein
VFLRLFQRHIPPTFPIFERSSSMHKHPPSYVLAAAAVGGLFCAVAGSAEVARSMYNDARRLNLAAVSVLPPGRDYDLTRQQYHVRPEDSAESIEDKLVTIKTVCESPRRYEQR